MTWSRRDVIRLGSSWASWRAVPRLATYAQSPFADVAFRTVEGVRLASRSIGAGRPIVFIHGNPTSSYLWRRVAPALAGHGRCIAVDLFGMGQSSKATAPSEAAYSLATQRRLLAAHLTALGVGRDVVLVLHDWGTVLGFDWARSHPTNVAGIAHMEGFVEPVESARTPAQVVEWFRRYRTDEGARMVLQDNQFVERVLFGQLPGLADADRAVYRAPFQTPADRWPTLAWPRQVPIDGRPADVHQVMTDAWAWMSQSLVPKLFINADPGAMVVGARRDIARAWPRTTEVTVSARHFVPEDAPDQVVGALDRWLSSV